jgi:hypothetical protein
VALWANGALRKGALPRSRPPGHRATAPASDSATIASRGVMSILFFKLNGHEPWGAEVSDSAIDFGHHLTLVFCRPAQP